MERLITITNKIHDAFNVLGHENPVSLPQIVVVGSQSAGKSSVLESIVGKSFLPRGSGIVTRCPCVIQLHHSAADEFAQFLHDNTGRKFRLEEVAAEIVRETERKCGGKNSKVLSSQPINLRIHSPHVVDLTLVDLPGITRVPVADQPADIAQQIENMVMDWVARPDSILLAVSSANSDLANSDALMISRRVDPEGQRTLGVLTKLDLMDKGTDAKHILLGNSMDVPRLRLGYIAVVNRSQSDIDRHTTVQDARRSEMEFFRTHHAYKTLGTNVGTEHLVLRCSQLLVQAIQQSLPQILADLDNAIHNYRKELASIPGGVPFNKRHIVPTNTTTTNSEQDIARAALVDLVVDYTAELKQLLKGDSSCPEADPWTVCAPTPLSPGARIEAIFTHIFMADVNNLRVLDDMTPKDVQTLVQNVRGLGGGLFTPDEVLITLIKRQVNRLREANSKCIGLVFDELARVVEAATLRVPGLQHYPACANALKRESMVVFARGKEKALSLLDRFVDMELYRINFSHPDFAGRKGITVALRESRRFTTAIPLGSLPGQQLQPPNSTTNTAASLAATTGGNAGGVAGRVGSMSRRFQLLTKINAGEQLSLDEQRELAAGLGGAPPPQQSQAAQPLKQAPPQPLGAPPPRLPPTNPRSTSNATETPLPANASNDQLQAYLDEKLASYHATMNADERAEVTCLLRLQSSYFDIVKKTACDQVPKAVGLVMVGECVDQLRGGLISTLTADAVVSQLGEVASESAKRAEHVRNVLKMLDAARDALVGDVVKTASFGA